jgi:hypothetical protein
MGGANIDYFHPDRSRIVLELDAALFTPKRRLRGSSMCRVHINPVLRAPDLNLTHSLLTKKKIGLTQLERLQVEIGSLLLVSDSDSQSDT